MYYLSTVIIRVASSLMLTCALAWLVDWSITTVTLIWVVSNVSDHRAGNRIMARVMMINELEYWNMVASWIHGPCIHTPGDRSHVSHVILDFRPLVYSSVLAARCSPLIVHYSDSAVVDCVIGCDDSYKATFLLDLYQTTATGSSFRSHIDLLFKFIGNCLLTIKQHQHEPLGKWAFGMMMASCLPQSKNGLGWAMEEEL